MCIAYMLVLCGKGRGALAPAFRRVIECYFGMHTKGGVGLDFGEVFFLIFGS